MLHMVGFPNVWCTERSLIAASYFVFVYEGSKVDYRPHHASRWRGKPPLNFPSDKSN